MFPSPDSQRREPHIPFLAKLINRRPADHRDRDKMAYNDPRSPLSHATTSLMANHHQALFLRACKGCRTRQSCLARTIRRLMNKEFGCFLPHPQWLNLRPEVPVESERPDWPAAFLEPHKNLTGRCRPSLWVFQRYWRQKHTLLVIRQRERARRYFGSFGSYVPVGPVSQVSYGCGAAP